ncbi:acyl carrier protein [Rhodoplanes roseus]|uniref:Acyl carrier protein n=1 Tax=Rhodoplanes roseus TaxID=29409 RepID=A0A327KZJ3_9BRAD|nr:acyl carrier protein [Rhodoplanes roseus]RAI44310.1 acyl carrier protein [Rhodoplanes roseus]
MTTMRRDQIRTFINDNFLFREDRESIADGDSLLDAGLIDSTGILELVAFLETEFGLVVDDADIVPENLDSIDRIAAYVDSKLNTAAAA